MNTRKPIQSKTEPAVLSVSFSASRKRLAVGLSNGIRVFKSNDCLRTLKESPGNGGGIAISAVLDDR